MCTATQVLPGARVPADGEVYTGSSHVDESMLTGESLPVPKQAGSTVIGGTMNLGGMIQASTASWCSQTFSELSHEMDLFVLPLTGLAR